MARLIALIAVAALGCAPGAGVPERAQPPWLAWQAPLGREHPLVGKVFDSGLRGFVDPGHALERARRADFVLLGEKHDNPDHHRLQAFALDELVRAGRAPAVAFEMISRDRASALEAASAADPSDPDALARALDWQHSGWPEFALYRPLFASALAARLPLVAGDLTRAQLAQLRHGGLASLSPAERERLALEPPLSTAVLEALAAEVRDSHCGMAPDAMIEAMVAIQRVRDATLADSLLGAPSADGAVLIAGGGHVRKDRAVPIYLGRRAPERSVLALAFVEVPGGAPGSGDLEAQAAGFAAGFDLVWFTPRVDDEDPCEKFREQLEKLRVKPPEVQARAS